MNTAALDWKANTIEDDKGNPVTIAGVPGYVAANTAAGAGSTPWWSGTHSPVNGYYFSPTGGAYCTTSTNANDPNDFPLGLTAEIKELEVDSSGNPTQRTPIESIIICGVAFTNTDHPASYKVGDAAISAGTNLQKVVPKSATLLHEAFHLLFGVDTGEDPNNPGGFLEGDELCRWPERYPWIAAYARHRVLNLTFFDNADSARIDDIAQCIDAAKDNPVKTARRNPENYVFFVAHMYYLFGEPDGDAGTSIDKNWDFELMVQSGIRVLGAKDP